MKHLKTYNESLKDLMKPKSEEDILKFTKNLKPFDKLLLGCSKGILLLVKQAIEEGQDINRSGSYPLELAVNYNHIDIIKYLIDNGSYVYDKFYDIAIDLGYNEVAELLKKHLDKEEKFIFENFENYKYDVIRVHIENNEEFSKQFQELCFKYHITWIDRSQNYFSISLGDYCIDISFKQKKLFLNPILNGKVGENNLYYYNSKGLTVDQKIYTEKDLDSIKSILSHGHIGPSYKSRKIKRDI